MAQIIRNSGFSTQDIVTAAKLHNLVDTAVLGPQSISALTEIALADISTNDQVTILDTSVGSLNKTTINDLFNLKQTYNLGVGILGAPEPTDVVHKQEIDTIIRGSFSVQRPDNYIPDSYDPPVGTGGNDWIGVDSSGISLTNWDGGGRLYWQVGIRDNLHVYSNQNSIHSTRAFAITSLGGTGAFPTTAISSIYISSYRLIDEVDDGTLVGEVAYQIATPTRPEFTNLISIGKVVETNPTWTTSQVYASSGTPYTSTEREFVDFNSGTNVLFNGGVRIRSGIVFVGTEKEDPADEVIVDLTQVNNGIYEVAKSVVPSATWDASLGDIRRAAVDVPAIGKILLNQEFVIPANEVWLVEYEGWLIDSLDDAFTVCWKTSENGVETLDSTLQYPSSGIEYNELNHFFTLEGGTEGKTINIIIRGAANSGSGSDDNFIIFSTQNNRKGVRRVTKMKV